MSQVRKAALDLAEQGRVEEAVDLFACALVAVLRKSHDLELLVAKLQRARVGTRSERINPDQLRLLFAQLGDVPAERPSPAPDLEQEAHEDAELKRLTEEAEKANGEPKVSRRRKRRARRQADAAVERQVHYHDIPEAERACASCSDTKTAIGEDVTHRFEYVPGHLVDHEHHTVTYACPKCAEGVVTAEKPPQVIERSSADASLLAHVVVSKFVDHTPLHRLHGIYNRSGIDLPVSTLSDWVGNVADLVEPLVDRLGERVLRAFVVGTDATGLKVLDRASPTNIERGCMWAYVGGLDVVFRYAPTGEGATGPWVFLKGRTGYVQADAALVFERLYDGQVASAIELGCWCHARRRLVALQDTDCRVAYPLLLIGRLYRIERLGNARQISWEQRTALRQEMSMPVLDKIKRWLVPTLADETPGSDMAKACRYIANQWEALTRFVKDGRLSLDNNHTEQQMRAIAVGRHNYLFCGSHEAARRAAVLYSLTRTCALHGIQPLAYLTDVLRKLSAGWRHSRLDELLPGLWQPASPGTAEQ